MRAGFQLEALSYDSTDLRNQNGAFIFSGLEAFRADGPRLSSGDRARAASLSISSSSGGTRRTTGEFTKASLSFGARVTNFKPMNDDRNSFMPRAGFAWSPFKR